MDAVGRAFDIARSSRGRVTSVGGDVALDVALRRRKPARHDGVLVEELTSARPSQRLAFEPEPFDVVVTPSAVRGAALRRRRARAPPACRRVAAASRAVGPGVFAPAHGAADEIAGQGVANPASMLLAAALMLGEGLGERRAAETLAGAVLEACCNGTRTPDMVSPASARRRASSPTSSSRSSPSRDERRVLPGGRRMRPNGADAILRSLEAEGVEVVFGIPGGAILPHYDAFARGTTVRHVLARHEQGAGHMAEGYARATGRVGVALATSGPGATNLVTPIADAWMDSTPLVCITGQVRAHLIGTDAFQECDITGITMPIVKHSWLVQDVEELPHVLKAAFHVARTGRCGPVLVDVPRDVQEAALDFAYPDEVDLPGWKPPQRGHPRQIKRAPPRSQPPSGRSSTSAAERSTPTPAPSCSTLAEVGAAARSSRR